MSTGRAQQKATMHELKLRRILEHNHRLREEFARPRAMVSVSSLNIINHCRNTKDPLIPSIWGPLPKGEDPFNPVEEAGCCSDWDGVVKEEQDVHISVVVGTGVLDVHLRDH